MSGTVEVDDSSLAPTASSMMMRRGMETAFLMVGLQALFRPLLVCVFARVCVSLGTATCLARLWLFVVGVTSKKTKKVCVRAMCEFQLFAACTCADSASSAAVRLPGNPRLSSARSISCSPLFRRDVVSGNCHGILERKLDGHSVRVDRGQHSYLTGRDEE